MAPTQGIEHMLVAWNSVWPCSKDAFQALGISNQEAFEPACVLCLCVICPDFVVIMRRRKKSYEDPLPYKISSYLGNVAQRWNACTDPGLDPQYCQEEMDSNQGSPQFCLFMFHLSSLILKSISRWFVIHPHPHSILLCYEVWSQSPYLQWPFRLSLPELQAHHHSQVPFFFVPTGQLSWFYL